MKKLCIDETTFSLLILIGGCWISVYLINEMDVVHFYGGTHSIYVANVTLDSLGIWVHSGPHPYQGSMITIDPNDDLETSVFYQVGVYYRWIRLNNYEEWTFSLRWWLIVSVLIPLFALTYNIRRCNKKRSKKASQALNDTASQD